MCAAATAPNQHNVEPKARCAAISMAATIETNSSGCIRNKRLGKRITQGSDIDANMRGRMVRAKELMRIIINRDYLNGMLVILCCGEATAVSTTVLPLSASVINDADAV